MPKSKAQMSRATLQQMNITPAGEDPSAADAKFVEDKYDLKLSEWRDEGLVYWSHTGRYDEVIPDQVYGTICDLMENEIRNTYRGDNPPAQRVATEQFFLGRIRKHLSRRPSGEQTSFSSY